MMTPKLIIKVRKELSEMFVRAREMNFSSLEIEHECERVVCGNGVEMEEWEKVEQELLQLAVLRLIPMEELLPTIGFN